MYTNGINVYVAPESLAHLAGPDWVPIPADAALTPAQAARLTKYAGQDAGANEEVR